MTDTPDDEQLITDPAEIERAKRELEEAQERARELEKQLGVETDPPRRHRVRGAIAIVLLVLGTIMTPVSIAAVYARAQITDTARYVDTVGPLASDPQVKAYLADVITKRVLARVDVRGYVTDVLPPKAAPLAGPLTSAVEGFVHTVASRLVDSQAFVKTWVNANRLAHNEINALLDGKDDKALIQDRGVVYLNLQPVIREVTQRLSDAGLTVVSKVPVDKIQGRVALFKSKGLYKTRDQIRLVLKLAWALPFITIALLLGSAWLSGNRRRGLLRAATGFALGAVILAVALSFSRSAYLDALTGAGIPHGAAATVFDTLLAPMHQVMRVVLSLSVLVLIATLLAGPSRPARWFRGWVVGGVRHLGRMTDDAGWAAARPSRIMQEHAAIWRWGAVAIGVVALLLWTRPTPVVIIWLGVLVVALLLVIEFYARPGGQESAGASPAAT